MFPTLMLFVFLLFETAKVSRYKIRHQFAVDAAAFVEMTNYSDFLNRTAYVNGAFPMRIFREGFHDTPEDCRGKDPCPAPGYHANGGTAMVDDIMYHDGAFPRDDQNPDGVPPGTRSWQIRFPDTGASFRSGMNSATDPDVDSHDQGSEGGAGCSPPCTLIFNVDTVRHWNIGWDDSNQVFKLYVQIYQLLGSVEAAQYKVLWRLAQNHNFMSKSYYLNIGDTQALQEAGQAVQAFRRSADPFTGKVAFWCTPKMRIYGYVPQRQFLQATDIMEQEAKMPNTIDCIGQNGGLQGLFQVATVDPATLDSMSSPIGQWSKGWPVEVHWTAPNNYWGVDLNGLLQSADNGGPKVRASVALYRGQVGCNGQNCPAQIWPDPTPKFQVRLYP